MKNAEFVLTTAYDKLFEFVCEQGYELYDLVVSLKTMDGLDITLSWHERNNRLEEAEKNAGK